MADDTLTADPPVADADKPRRPSRYSDSSGVAQEVIEMPRWKTPMSGGLSKEEYDAGKGDPGDRAEYEAQENARWGREQTEKNAAAREADYERYRTRRDALHAEQDAQLRSPHPAIPDPKQVGPAPDQRDFQKGSMEFAAAMALIIGFSGRGSRLPAGAAMNAYAEAINGWNEGSQKKYDNAMKQWDQNMRATLENNNAALKKYDLILQDRSLTSSEIAQRIQLVANEYRDDEMYRRAKDGDIAAIGKWRDAQWEATNGPKGATGAFEKTKARYDEHRIKMQEWSDNTGAKMAATDFVDPNTHMRYTNPRTKQPFTDGEVAGMRAHLEEYPPGSVPAGLGTGKGSGAGPALTEDALQRMVEMRAEQGMPESRLLANMGKLDPARTRFRNAYTAYARAHNITPEMQTERDRQWAAKNAAATAGARTEAVRETNLEITLRNVQKAIPRAIETSAAYTRAGGKWVPLNRLFQTMDENISDERLKAFKIANLQVADLWGQSLNYRGVVRIDDRKLALENLLTATSHKAYLAALREVNTFINRENEAVHEQKAGVPMKPLPESMFEEGGGRGGGGGSRPPISSFFH